MVFKKILRALGVGGPSVETELTDPRCTPGGVLEGTIRITGSEHPIDVEYVSIGLITPVEWGDDDPAEQEFHRQRLTGSFRLDPGRAHELPFRFEVPWETPITRLYGQELHGMTMGLSTEIAVARTVDRADLDPVEVNPLPAQELILDALLRLGFRFGRAGVQHGRILTIEQRLPFYQEIEFEPPSTYASALNQLELTFVPTPERLQVVLEVDRRGGFLTEEHEKFGTFLVDYATADQEDWPFRLDVWLRESAVRRGRAL